MTSRHLLPRSESSECLLRIGALRQGRRAEAEMEADIDVGMKILEANEKCQDIIEGGAQWFRLCYSQIF
jgi:hypothetical protein